MMVYLVGRLVSNTSTGVSRLLDTLPTLGKFLRKFIDLARIRRGAITKKIKYTLIEILKVSATSYSRVTLSIGDVHLYVYPGTLSAKIIFIPPEAFKASDSEK